MADHDAALMQGLLSGAQRQRAAGAEHHRQADDFRAGLERVKGAWFGHSGRPGGQIASFRNFPLTAPLRHLSKAFVTSRSLSVAKKKRLTVIIRAVSSGRAGRT